MASVPVILLTLFDNRLLKILNVVIKEKQYNSSTYENRCHISQYF